MKKENKTSAKGVKNEKYSMEFCRALAKSMYYCWENETSDWKWNGEEQITISAYLYKDMGDKTSCVKMREVFLQNPSTDYETTDKKAYETIVQRLYKEVNKSKYPLQANDIRYYYTPEGKYTINDELVSIEEVIERHKNLPHTKEEYKAMYGKEPQPINKYFLSSRK